MPHRMDFFFSIKICASCSVLLGLLENWGWRKCAPSTGRQVSKTKWSSLYRGAASLAAPQLKVPESHCLLKATETCFQVLIKCNNSLATWVIRNFIYELVCTTLHIVIAGGGFKWSHIVLLGLKVHRTLNCIPRYGTLYVRRIVSPTRQSSIRKVARAWVVCRVTPFSCKQDQLMRAPLWLSCLETSWQDSDQSKASKLLWAVVTLFVSGTVKILLWCLLIGPLLTGGFCQVNLSSLGVMSKMTRMIGSSETLGMRSAIQRGRGSC